MCVTDRIQQLMNMAVPFLLLLSLVVCGCAVNAQAKPGMTVNSLGRSAPVIFKRFYGYSVEKDAFPSAFLVVAVVPDDHLKSDGDMLHDVCKSKPHGGLVWKSPRHLAGSGSKDKNTATNKNLTEAFEESYNQKNNWKKYKDKLKDEYSTDLSGVFERGLEKDIYIDIIKNGKAKNYYEAHFPKGKKSNYNALWSKECFVSKLANWNQGDYRGLHYETAFAIWAHKANGYFKQNAFNRKGTVLLAYSPKTPCDYGTKKKKGGSCGFCCTMVSNAVKAQNWQSRFAYIFKMDNTAIFRRFDWSKTCDIGLRMCDAAYPEIDGNQPVRDLFGK